VRYLLAVLAACLCVDAAAQSPAFEAATVRRNLSGPVGTDTPFQAAAFRTVNSTVRELTFGRSVSMGQLASDLSQNLDRAVIDQTGLMGLFDLDLKWDFSPADAAATGLFTALAEQLELKLEGQRAPVEVLVIDSVERPTQD
jgi:uncharacterized protein (TIGR03435 family)